MGSRKSEALLCNAYYRYHYKANYIFLTKIKNHHDHGADFFFLQNVENNDVVAFLFEIKKSVFLNPKSEADLRMVFLVRQV